MNLIANLYWSLFARYVFFRAIQAMVHASEKQEKEEDSDDQLQIEVVST